ncbi:MAG: amino acid/amide ABC transporter substrate-binding protein, HAAT family [uncultured archaeon A07HR60]|jgi:ABC-type branched-chain amino acid transport systems, periplasmic component|nr:MAG: amino acid/amide ABC transporter substrate-binding protein, HAAT family [uncultured archaeon A07HR60]
MSSNDKPVSRRTLLKTTGAAGAAGLTGLAGCTGGEDSSGGGGDESDSFPALGNFPVEGDSVTFGFNIPQSGPYSSEGEDELRGYNLAKDHLNNGGGWVDSFEDLSGDGVLGYTVDSVEGDTATDPDTARQSAQRMINRDDAVMIAGGSSSSVAISVQGLCQDENVMFMAALTHSNDTTGKDAVRYGFREMFNAYMTGQALAPVLEEEYGSDNTFYQLYADYSWGQTVQESMNQFLTDVGWEELDSVPTPLGTSDFSSYLSEAQNSGADVLLLDHYGLDGANSVKQSVDAGLDEELEIVVPLYNRPMAQAAGGAIEDAFGTIAWDSQIDNEAANVFTDVFQAEYDRIPSGPAQLAYSGTLQYAAAAERAGTFYPPEVIRELEGYEFSNSGLGSETMRACDHQAQRDIPVARGLPESEQSDGNFIELVNLTSRDDVGYGCDTGPAAEVELGPYGDE